MEPRPAFWKPFQGGGQHRNRGYGCRGYNEADYAEQDGSGRGARCVPYAKFAPSVKEHDHQGNGPEVGSDVAERLPVYDAEHRAKQNADAKEPDDVRHAGSFEDQFADHADQEDRGDKEQEERNGIHWVWGRPEYFRGRGGVKKKRLV